MCAECEQARVLLRKNGYSEKAAMAYLWNETAFPIAPGKDTLARVKRHLARRRTKARGAKR